MTEEELQELGKNYRYVEMAKVACYHHAQRIAGKKLPVHTQGKASIETMASLSDLEVGVMLAVDWGLDVPPPIIDSLSIKLSRPISSGLH